ncbi:ribosomal protein L11 methyltransferase [bacterium BMS3Abin03]|nr:ribosomal protein L11 methyltransferase [bacterium BMS3Abin03]
MKKFKEFIVKTEPFTVDLVSSVLWEYDIAGINEQENLLIVFADENSLTNKAILESALSKLADEKVINSFTVDEKIIEDKNRNEEWEKGREVIKISNKIIIKPSFKDYTAKDDEIVITIDPKISFGTGGHESTKLILLLLEKYINGGEKILDVGSGTGILSIAAIKLGAASSVAVDIDEWCYDNCVENCKLNSVDKQVDIIKGKIDDVSQNNFDLVLANIQKNILLYIAQEIRVKVKKNGVVILSGLLLRDEDEIVKHYQSLGLKFLEKEIMNEWLAVVLSKF